MLMELGFHQKRLSDDLVLLHGRPLSFLLQGKRHVAKSLCKDGKSEGEKMKRVDFHPFCATLQLQMTLWFNVRVRIF